MNEIIYDDLWLQFQRFASKQLHLHAEDRRVGAVRRDRDLHGDPLGCAWKSDRSFPDSRSARQRSAVL